MVINNCSHRQTNINEKIMMKRWCGKVGTQQLRRLRGPVARHSSQNAILFVNGGNGIRQQTHCHAHLSAKSML